MALFIKEIKYKVLKKIRHILNITIWFIFGAYLFVSILFHIPAIQQYTGKFVAQSLQKALGTKVYIGRIDLGFLNRIIIDDFSMLDQKGKQMLNASRLSVSINPFLLYEGKIEISDAQIFGLKAQLYKNNATAEPNYKFVIDSLSTGTESKSSLNLSINSFIIRNGAVCYNQKDVAPTPNKFNPYHINIQKLSTNITARHITDNKINISVKRLSFKEESGLDIKKISFNIIADKERCSINDFSLILPNTEIYSKEINTCYRITDSGVEPSSIKAKGDIVGKKLSLADFSSILPALGNIAVPLYFNSSFTISDNVLSINKFKLNSLDNDFKFAITGHASPFNGMKYWDANIYELYAGEKTLKNIEKIARLLKYPIPVQFTELKYISIKSTTKCSKRLLATQTNISTSLGNIKARINKNASIIEAEVNTDEFNIKDLLSDNKFGNVSLSLKAKASTNLDNISLRGCINKIEYSKNTYRDININGKYSRNYATGIININDPNCKIDLSGEITDIKGLPEANLNASIKKLNPQKLGISNKWGNANFMMEAKARICGKNISKINGDLSINNFNIKSQSQDYTIDSFNASIHPNRINIISDFGKLELKGKYKLQTIGESIKGVLKEKLPTMPGLEKRIYASDNIFTLNATINDTKWLNIFCGIPIVTEKPINISANINDIERKLNANISIPDFSYDNGIFRNGKVDIKTINDTLFVSTNIKKILSESKYIDLSVKGNAINNKFSSCFAIDYNTPTKISGEINSSIQFYKNKKGINSILLDINPSNIMVKDTAWNLRPSKIIYNKSEIRFENFAIERGQQHIKINGVATKSASDSICVDLKNVDVKYILDLVDFHSVEFSGLASGSAYLKSVLNSPDAYANISVDNFKFQDGKMGKLFADVCWNNTDKQIDIKAHADEENGAQTIINGYVSPSKNYIDLGITAKNTNIEFLHSFCNSFMDNIHAKANGFAQVYGDLSAVNLRGLLTASGSLRIKTLNTVYNLKNDTIVMQPNEIIFNNDSVSDRNGNIATISGALHHKNLTRLTYDLDIKTHNFLCYDFKDYLDNTFYGTIYGTGNCSIKGRHHSILFNINITPEKNSFIEYNAASPDAITSQNFINWINHDLQLKDTTTNTGSIEQRTPDLNESSDIHINFNVNTTQDFNLRVLMDKTSGDCISLNGNGAIKATYFNKGNFDMFGTYLINHGTYSLTIQNIIKKNFNFQQGSSIVFGGNPFNAVLNLKAIYPVNGVSLADLKVGNNFSNNNVRVDCIMNIGGTPENIRVDFDFDLPTVNNDAKQMIKSLINSEEEMNQQVVYLLAIGRFYTDDKNNSTQEDAQQSQTSLAMQSLLSGTISQQINTILGSVIKDKNWNFGTNISTGTEGFNNAEYEGLLSGSLFSNRLLINGQFGYRDNPNTTTSFIGDFDVKYLLTPNGNIAIKVYNQTNDRYFTKSSLNTQGIGIILKRDFNNWRELFWRKKEKKK